MQSVIKTKKVFDKEILKEIRKVKCLTQDEVSSALGIHVSVYQFWERGLYSPNRENSFKLASFFKCDEESFYRTEQIQEKVEEKHLFKCQVLVDKRSLKGETQQELADYLGVHPSSIRKWEKGFRRPNDENLKMLAKHFNCDEEDFTKD